MGTRHVEVTGAYTDIGAVAGSTFYVQNKGSSKLELFIGDSAPLASAEGLTLYPKDVGNTITLEGSEVCYAKTENKNHTSILLLVE